MTDSCPKTKVVIFGCGITAESVSIFFKNFYPEYEISGYVADSDYAGGMFNGKIVHPVNDIESIFPVAEYKVFIALGYQELNNLRKEKYQLLKGKGYEFVSCIAPGTFYGESHGENCFIAPGAAVQPGVKIGACTFFWSGTAIGHNSAIGDYCWFAVNCSVNGQVNIENHCFIGAGAIVGHNVTVAEKSFLGAGTLVTKSTEKESVVIRKNDEAYPLKSSAFVKMFK